MVYKIRLQVLNNNKKKPQNKPGLRGICLDFYWCMKNNLKSQRLKKYNSNKIFLKNASVNKVKLAMITLFLNLFKILLSFFFTHLPLYAKYKIILHAI